MDSPAQAIESVEELPAGDAWRVRIAGRIWIVPADPANRLFQRLIGEGHVAGKKPSPRA